MSWESVSSLGHSAEPLLGVRDGETDMLEEVGYSLSMSAALQSCNFRYSLSMSASLQSCVIGYSIFCSIELFY